MSESTTVSQPSAAPKSLPARLIGVIVSPAEAFRGIAAHPKWFGALATVTVVIAVCTFVFLRTEVGQNAWLDQQIRQSETWTGNPVTPEAQAGMERMQPIVGYIAAAFILIGGPIFTLILAGILYGVFTGLMGGSAGFKQVMAVVAHAGAVNIIQQLFVLPLNYARETMTSATTLAVFLPFLEEGSFLNRFLGMIDLFFIWWVIVASIGLAVLYKRRTGPVVWSLLGVYVLIVGVIATVMSLFAKG